MGLFARIGYARASTRAIADEAGVNQVTLFRHFGNKKSLLLACVEQIQETGFASTFEQHLTGDYTRDIPVMARIQMEDMARRYGAIRLLLTESSEVPEFAEMVRTTSGENAQRLADYFRRQIESGVVRSDLNPLELAYAFDAMFSSYVFFRTALGTEDTTTAPPEPVIRSLAGIFVRGTIK